MENLRRDARMRIETDYEMTPAWILVPLIPGIVAIVVVAGLFATISTYTIVPGQPPPPGFIAAIFGSIAILLVVGIVSGIAEVYMLYRLVNRRNKHFLRQSFVYDNLTALARELAAKKGVDISISLNNMERSNREAKYEETEKSAALWAIVTLFVGLTVFYVFYFLMKDFYRHERREDMFFDDLNRAFIAAGATINLPRRTIPLPDRSFVLYLVLTIVTFGIFGFYWLYVLLTDPNNHFRQQSLIEDTILSQITPIMA